MGVPTHDFNEEIAMNRLTKFTVPALTAAAALALSSCGGAGNAGAGGEGFTPPDNVRMIVPFGAGGGSDLAGRATAKGLEEVIGSTVTVENITGGDGAVGYAELMASKGDTGTLLSSETAPRVAAHRSGCPVFLQRFHADHEAGRGL
jgi:putative tricarboxylic transport membrane protein